MARGKKKETLTPEERLQAALVPDWEQPYKVPENWCWTKLSSLSNMISKGTTPKGGKSSYSDNGVKFLRVENINDDGTISHENIAYVSEETHKSFLKRSILEENDILISIAGTLGKTGIIRNVDLPMNTNQAVAFVRTVSDKVNVKYIKNSIDNPVIQDILLGKTKVTSIPNLTLETIGECPIPLPPFPEQQRIVDRIESLFAKLDEAKQKAQDALDSFETRRAAILHKAFTGELTAQWRKEHGVGMESWARHPLKDVTQIGSGGTPSRKNSQYYLGDILWVKTGEIYWNYIYDSEEKITEEAITNSSAKLYPAGTVLVAMYGQGLTRGRAAILGVPATTNQAVCALQPCDRLENRYLYYYFMANYWEYREKAVGGNQPNYSATMIGKWIINIPSVLEQAEIVRILDDLLAKEQQAKEATEAVLEQIDLIKKSILARAFRGELGTNDPADENAVELLKKII